jgi:hypothetical protein
LQDECHGQQVEQETEGRILVHKTSRRGVQEIGWIEQMLKAWCYFKMWEGEIVEEQAKVGS